MRSRLLALLRYAALAAAGVLQAFSLAWPFEGAWYGRAFGILQILGLALALGVLVHASNKQTAPAGFSSSSSLSRSAMRKPHWANFRRAWWFATVWLCAVFWWLFISMHVYGGMPSWLAALAVALLAAGLALYYAFVLTLWLWARPRLGRWAQVLLFAVLWLLAELCRGVVFTGFPWGAIGYAHIDNIIAGYAPWVGVYGMSAIAAALSAVLMLELQTSWPPVFSGAGAYHSRNTRWIVGAVFAMAIVFLGTWLSQPSVGTHVSPPDSQGLRVALLQGNIPQEEKFQPNGGMELALDWYGQQMTQNTQADLLVLPETALPMFPQQLPEGYWQALQQRFGAGSQAVLIGLPAGDVREGYANAVVGMAPGGAQSVGAGSPPQFGLPPSQLPEYRYAKHHLVPFGEFVPFGFQWFVDMMRMPLGNYERGSLAQPRLLYKGERIQPNICYEDLFGEELAAAFIDPATAPTILVNVSNIGWFGNTVAIDQHRHISRMRAKELARPMLRATNTGSTALIDSEGKVVQELPRHTRDVLQVQVTGNDAQPTLFAWWAARWGLWPLWLLGFAVACGLLWRSAKTRN